MILMQLLTITVDISYHNFRVSKFKHLLISRIIYQMTLMSFITNLLNTKNSRTNHLNPFRTLSENLRLVMHFIKQQHKYLSQN